MVVLGGVAVFHERGTNVSEVRPWVAQLKGEVSFETADLESLEGKYDTVTCIDVRPLSLCLSLFLSLSLCTPSLTLSIFLASSLPLSLSLSISSSLSLFLSFSPCLFLSLPPTPCFASQTTSVLWEIGHR